MNPDVIIVLGSLLSIAVVMILHYQFQHAREEAYRRGFEDGQAGHKVHHPQDTDAWVKSQHG